MSIREAFAKEAGNIGKDLRAPFQAALDSLVGIPSAMKPTIPEILPEVAAYKATPGNDCGGSLHIVLDDGNVKNADVEFCIQWARDKEDAAGVALGEKLLLMSKTQRLKIHDLFHELPFPEQVHSPEVMREWMKGRAAQL